MPKILAHKRYIETLSSPPELNARRVFLRCAASIKKKKKKILARLKAAIILWQARAALKSQILRGSDLSAVITNNISAIDMRDSHKIVDLPEIFFRVQVTVSEKILDIESRPRCIYIFLPPARRSRRLCAVHTAFIRFEYKFPKAAEILRAEIEIPTAYAHTGDCACSFDWAIFLMH